jgi:hypothetical protein
MLLTSSRSIPIKTASHHLARNALARITEQRVLDAAVNTLPEGDEQKDPLIDAKFELPQILIEKLTPPLTNPADSMDVSISVFCITFLDVYVSRAKSIFCSRGGSPSNSLTIVYVTLFFMDVHF